MGSLKLWAAVDDEKNELGNGEGSLKTLLPLFGRSIFRLPKWLQSIFNTFVQRHNPRA